MNPTNRRDFLKKAGAVIGFGFAAGSFASLINACERDETLPVKPPEMFVIQLGQYPQLSTVGGVVKVDPPAGKNNNQPLIVSRVGQNEYKIFDSTCPHQGCSINLPAALNGPMPCPCHDVGFDSITGSTAYNNIGVNINPLRKLEATYNPGANTLSLQI